MLESIFNAVINMSITASVVAALVMLFRLLLGSKLPKAFSYMLWAIVLLRLLIPFSIPSKISIFNAIPVPKAVVSESGKEPIADYRNPLGLDDVDSYQKIRTSDIEGSSLKDYSSLKPSRAAKGFEPYLIFFAAWLAGVVGFLSFSITAYVSASNRLRDAVLFNNDLLSHLCRTLKLKKKVRIYTSDRIDTPAVFGLTGSSIILPLSLVQNCSEDELRHIVAHELVHIKRFDQILKPLFMLVLCVHWFNPVLWLSFMLFQKDMEQSCDEKVMSSFDSDIRSVYATSLIKLASKQNLLFNSGMLAFGESNIKRRVKRIMNFKKPRLWIVIVMFAVLTATSFVLLTNGASKPAEINKKGVDNKQITRFAEQLIKRNIADLEEIPGVKIIDSRITRLELIKSFDKLTGTPIDVYALEYRMLPEDPKKVVLAGGMSMDEKGWLRETCSAGSPLMVVSVKGREVQSLATMWTGTVAEEGGLEACIKKTLKIKDEEHINNPADKKTIDKLLSIIISSPSSSSNTGDYIKAHQKEADEIVDMGEKALPYLTEIIDSGDKGLRGNVVWLLSERIIKELGANGQSPETEKLVKESAAAVDKWKVSMGYDKASDAEISEDLKKFEAQEDGMLSQAHALNSIIMKLSSINSKYSGGNMKWPVSSSNKISSAYGYKYHPILNKKYEHTGIDIPASKGNSIVAADDGTVILADYITGYGNTVIIDHGGSIATLYGHCSSFDCSVGDKVKAGEVIAKVGSTGLSTGPHCHFEVRVNGATVNPLEYIKSE